MGVVKIQPLKYEQRFAGKSNNAYLFTFDNGKQYVVKFLKEGQEKVLFNEWIGYGIARYLQLPVPPGRFVEIPEAMLSKLEEYDQIKSTTTQFASEFIPNCQNAHELKSPNVINQDQLAGIIILDYWLYNLDRTRKNILFKEVDKGHHHLYIIDQADLFGSFSWELNDLTPYSRKLFKSSTHQLIASFIKSESAFFDQLNIVQSIPIHLLYELITLTPDSWGITDVEKERILEYLVTRRDKTLPKLISDFIKTKYHPIQGNV